jgi:hypothetical protein
MTRPDGPAWPRPACCNPIRPCRGTVAILIAALALAGCASTPQASAVQDSLNKQFLTHPDSATLYVFRPDRSPDPDTEDTVLYVGDRLIGATLPGTYFRIDLLPGVYRLHGLAHDNGSLSVEIRRGEVTFVALTSISGSSRFARVQTETARRELTACCALMESWAPGQRPLLR